MSCCGTLYIKVFPQYSQVECFVHVKKMLFPEIIPVVCAGVPGDVGGGVMVEKEELKMLLYNPGQSEWPPCGRDEECDRIVHGLEEVMQHSMAEPFNAPVDLNAFPLYAHVIEYPVDLSTIKARLENRFYR